ncbi:Ecdysis triggering hormone receptor [Caligus rogercresseyi]|uniref:Ecdysis triggering hormone receptor n=1 Tax=Caligus rogercresseyi TaxID=217165 RepID=A0A7T8K117_CALRO|nr:Ecdysis triggering hormone receptor [Caligus rogercresseyi]
MVPYVELSIAHTSVLIILAITGERYYAICLPLHAGSICRKSKAWILCGASWLFAFGVTAPVLGTVEYSEEGDFPTCLTSVDEIWAKNILLCNAHLILLHSPHSPHLRLQEDLG